MRSRSVDISSEDVDNSEMTSNSGIYTISKRELEGHDNLGHSISQVTITDEKTEAVVGEVNGTMPLKPKVRLGPKFGISIDIIIAILAFVWIVVAEFGYVPNYKQGFYCETDDKIVYKYKGDSISTAWIIISATFPIIIMYFVEVCRCDREVSKAIKSKKTIYQVFLWTREYLVGLVVKLFIVETLKVVIGELRPHFLDTCKPNAAINCTRGDFITEYTCTNKNDSYYLISDSSKSFPSGHASIGFYEGLFLAWYLHRRFPTCNSVFIRPILQCLSLTWGLVCGATRVVDNRHHWWDVVTGDIIGAIFAILVCTVMCKNFKLKSVIPEHTNQNGHASVRRLLSNNSCKDETNIAMAQA